MAGAQNLQAQAAPEAAPTIGPDGLPLGTPCANCGTPLRGPWCHACGQKGEDYHRSVFLLVAEAFEGLTHFDGRFWRTFPRLVWKPGALTRDYLEGRRAAQIPPFRLFLVVLLVVFFSGGLSFQTNDVKLKAPETVRINSPEDREAVEALQTAVKQSPSGRWLTERIEHAVHDPRAFFTAMEHWSHQFAILMLPIAALLLSVLFVFKRGLYVFDHLIFSMHSLSFQGLLLSVVFLAGLALDGAAWLLLIAPVHLFVHMRGTYRISVAGTLLRMFLLFIGSATAFLLLMSGLVVVGLATAH